MKQLLILLAAGMCAANVAAYSAVEQAQGVTVQSVISSPKHIATPRILSAHQLGTKCILQTVTDATGFTYKRMVNIDNPNVPIKTMRTASRVRANAETSGINENFEGSNGRATWQPTGWSTESKIAGSTTPWKVTKPYETLKNISGTYAEIAEMAEKKADEWLYTPAFTVKENDQLQFLAWYDLIFGLDFEYVDEETIEFYEWHPSQDLIVWAKEEGTDEWIKLKDFFDDADGKTFDELFELLNNAFEKHVLDLSQFVGKTIVVGFQYVGANGNGCGIDDVMVGMPEYDCEYDYPASTMFFGTAPDFSSLGNSLPILPAYSPITWSNNTKIVDGTNPTFTWLYYDENNKLTTAVADDLTASYRPDYSTEATTANTFVYSPMLIAEADGWSEGMYSVFDFFQAGGKADYKIGGKATSYGMSVSDAATESYTYAMVYDSHGNAIPMFGYAPTLGEIWTNAFFGGNAGSNYAKISAVFNVVDAPISPMVINGLWSHACVKNIKPDVDFTIEVRPLSKEGYILEPIATSTITSAELGKDGAIGDYKSLMFRFDEPLVMSTDVCEKYIIRLTGFDECGDYFAPLQAYFGHYNGVNHGYLEFEISNGQSIQYATQDLEYFSNYPQSFGFNLDAYYPWLEGVSEATVPATSSITIPLDSYYDGSELTITSSDTWLSATAAGRYNKCELTITSTSPDNRTGSITITAPGVNRTIAVTNESAGVETISANTADVTDIFDLQGRRIGANAPAGIYIRRHADGTATKVIVE